MVYWILLKPLEPLLDNIVPIILIVGALHVLDIYTISQWFTLFSDLVTQFIDWLTQQVINNIGDSV